MGKVVRCHEPGRKRRLLMGGGTIRDTGRPSLPSTQVCGDLYAVKAVSVGHIEDQASKNRLQKVKSRERHHLKLRVR